MTRGRCNFNKAEGDDQCLNSEMLCNCAMQFNKGLFRDYSAKDSIYKTGPDSVKNIMHFKWRPPRY